MRASSWQKIADYQPDVARILINSFKSDHLSHAYILEGPLGTKRIDTALLFAKTLLCHNLDQDFNPCGVCHNCRRIDELKHPNVFFVRAEGEQIKKKQIKELLIEFSKQSTEPGPRIYIIDEAERFNQESANTLLKTMEEPGQNIYQIMITSQINALLKTIVSRSQVLHFKPIGKKQIQSELEGEGFPNRVIDAISEYTNNTDEARAMAANPTILSTIDLVIEIYKNLLVKDKSIVLLFKDHRDLILQDSGMTDFFLTMMILFMKDILNYKIRYLDLIVFQTETEVIEKLSERIAQKKIEEQLDSMLDLKARLRYNINNSLAFDKLLVYLERGFNHGTSSSTN
ncbi:MAG: AAA family ATPase [Bacilli bacterium]|nr:AAA family ATPase [Bacilli bacterium]MBN2696478.1 AAA family ATPase [Bacilli bacterium]